MSQSPTREENSATVTRCPALGGSDVELCNFIVGSGDDRNTPMEAVRTLLTELEGIPAEGKVDTAWTASRDYPGVFRDNATFRDYGTWDVPATGRKIAINPQDWCRKFTLGGGSVYIDLTHAEICIPEIRTAFDFVKYQHAMLRLAAAAQAAANEQLRPRGASSK